MSVKDKKGGPISPILFKFGVALAASLGGVVYTFFRSKRIMPFKSNPGKEKTDSRGESGEFGDEDRRSLQNSINDLSSSGRHVVDRDGVLLPELEQLIKEYDMATNDLESPKEYKFAEHEECNREISSLWSKVEILEERERVLENQLLEYYGLKEQETAVTELQNRLRLHNMEAKLYNLKIESLQLDNKKLEAKVAGHEKVVTELESAQAKIKLLRKKLRFEAEQNREQILNLQERVMKLHDQEKKPVGINQDDEMQLQRSEELEELEEMKKYNRILKLEISELAQKMEKLQVLATSALDDEEIQALKEENQHLKQQNEDLRKEIEQLQADRCTEIEELVYLRWINACLRYEMRNYQPGPGETIARDLSRTLSPKSEEKAKKLILAYANKEGSGDKGFDISDLDSDQWSNYFTDSIEPDHSPSNKTNHPSKKKVLAKLLVLLRGKDNHHQFQTPVAKFASPDDIVSRNSHSDISLRVDVGKYRHSFDLQRPHSRGQNSTTGESSNCSQRASEDGSLNILRCIDSISGYDEHSSPGIQPHEDAQNTAKAELLKYAEALKNSRPKPVHRRSVTFGSF
ncbi:hypothetical protein ACS0TY_035248 [Phlomoides rotata]